MSAKKKELLNKAVDEIIRNGAKQLLNLTTSISTERRIELLDLALRRKLNNPPEKNESEQPFED